MEASRHQTIGVLMLQIESLLCILLIVMRTTLTIDDDVAFGLRKAQQDAPEKSFKEIVNEHLRRSLVMKPGTLRKKKFKVKAFKLGLRKDLNFDNIEEVLDILEGPNRR